MPAMTIHPIEDNFSQYAFAPMGQAHRGINVFVLEAQDRALLIDTGYAEYGKQLEDKLQRRQLQLDTVILSHFHDDHMGGLVHLKSPRLLGQTHYHATLEKWTPPDEHHWYVPTDPVASSIHLEFGNHSLVLMPISGHSESDLLILINERYLHIGDLILQDPYGTPILPAVEPPLLVTHLRALEDLRQYLDCAFLLSHGPIIHDRAIKQREIDDRLHYLEALLAHPTKISYADATQACQQTYLHTEWHEAYYT